MALGTMRIAICQLTCHPALAIGDRDFMAEPFFSKNQVASLSDFARHSLDMSAVQDSCRNAYLDWHSARVTAIVEWLKSLTPVPDVVVFPEGSIPSELLTFLKSFSEDAFVTVLCGTHSLKVSHDQMKLYKSLGINRHDTSRLNVLRTTPSASVLPIFSKDVAFFHPKQIPSIFELQDVSRPSPAHTLPEPVEISLRDGSKVRMLPLVCSEALQHTNIPSDIDLAVIPAFNDGIEPYEPLMKHLSGRRIPCVFCNDGHFGESCVITPLDRRPSYWWWEEPRNGKLSKGDSLLVVDVHYPFLAPQVGVSNPQSPVTLVAASQVVYSGQKGGVYAGCQSLKSIASINDNDTQAFRLNEILQDVKTVPLLVAKIEHLHRLAKVGNATVPWWSALANDCLIANSTDLNGLESTMAEKCRKSTQRLLSDVGLTDGALLGSLHLFDRACATLTTPLLESDKRSVSNSAQIVDRTNECRELQQFLEHPQQSLLILVGLDGIGKTTVVERAVNQTGRRLHRISIAPDTTLDYLGEWILRSFEISDLPPRGKASDVVTDHWLSSHIKSDDVVFIEKGQMLLSHGIWRDKEAPGFLFRLAQCLHKKGGKLIVESSFQFDVPGVEPVALRRFRVAGLDGESGTLLLDQHLRRSGVDPNNYEKAQRNEVVERLGGHPFALIIASEYIEQKGMGPVLSELRGRKGVHFEIVRRVIRDLDLPREQKIVLSLLSLARSPIRAEALAEIVGFDPLPAIRQLIQLSFIERSKGDNIEIASLLRGIWVGEELTDEIEQKFHRVVAQYFLSQAKGSDRVEELRFTVEARYHCLLSDDPESAPYLPGIVDGALGAASSLLNSDRLEAAKVIIDRLLAEAPSADIYELAALIYSGLGKCSEALVFAKETVSADRDRVWILTEVGRRAMHIRRDDLAADAIKIARGLGHDSAFIAVLEGKILLKNGDTQRAIEAFYRGAVFAETEPRRADGWAHFHLGRTYLKQGNIADAINALSRGEELEEKKNRRKRDALVAIRTQLALAYVYEGRLDVAERYFETVAELDSGNPEVARAFSIYKSVSGEENPAIDAIRKLDPNKASNRFDRCQIHLFRGLFFLNVGFPQKASEEFSAAHRADGTNVFVMLRWADTLEHIAVDLEADGESEAARFCALQVKELSDKILTFSPNNPDALAILEWLYDTFGIR